MPFIEAAAFFAAGQRGSPRLHHTRTLFFFLQDSTLIGRSVQARARHYLAYLAYSCWTQRFLSIAVDTSTTDRIAQPLESCFTRRGG